jgi:hypothetical protein
MNRATYSTVQFTIDRKGKTFISEISDLGEGFTQIYPDACDEGLFLQSHISGEVSTWYVAREEYSHGEDKELQAWHLAPTEESQKKFPALKGWKMVIFND